MQIKKSSHSVNIKVFEITAEIAGLWNKDTSEYDNYYIIDNKDVNICENFHESKDEIFELIVDLINIYD